MIVHHLGLEQIETDRSNDRIQAQTLWILSFPDPRLLAARLSPVMDCGKRIGL